MIKRSKRITAITLTAAVLGLSVGQTQASGYLPLLKACLAKVDQAANPQDARNQCIWQHWERMSEYGMK